NALGHRSTAAYDAVCGVPTSATDPNGRTTTYTYDALCRKTGTYYPDGGCETVQYLSYGSPSSQRTRTAKCDGTTDGLWGDVYFDGLGRTWRTVAEPGIYADKLFDSAGRLWKESNPYVSGETVYYTVHGYDQLGRPTNLTHPDGNSATRSYGVQSGTWCPVANSCIVEWEARTDEAGRTKYVYQDSRDFDAAIAEWDGGAWRYAYYGRDLLGRQTRIQDAAGNATTFAFDSLGRRTSMVDPDLGTWSYEYDLAGNLLAQTDAKAQRITFSYDAANRLVEKTYPGGATVQNYYDEAGYGDSKGRRTRQVDSRSGVQKAQVYDPEGRPTSTRVTISGTTYTIGQSYDVAGRPAALTYPDGEAVTTAYDAGGRVASVGGWSTYLSSVAYNGRGQMTSLGLGNNRTTTFGYNDQRGWLTSQVTGQPATCYQTCTNSCDGDPLANTAAVVGPVLRRGLLGPPGNIVDRLAGKAGRHLRDLAGRLLRSTGIDRPLRDVGVRTVGCGTYQCNPYPCTQAKVQDLTYTYNADGRIATIRDNLHGYESFNYAYDPLGRLASGTHTTTGGWSRSYTYDAIGKMTYNSVVGSYAYPAAGGSRPHAVTTAGGWSFTYDANGNTTAGAGRSYTFNEDNRPTQICKDGVCTTFAYDGDGERVQKISGGVTTTSVGALYEVKAGVATKYYKMGQTLIARKVSSAPGPEWFLGDRQGGVQKIVDANGGVVRHQMFLPFGERVVFNDTSQESRSGLTGHRYDAETGLVFMGARYYDPVLGRFVTPDAARQLEVGPQGLDPYSYAGNDPTNATDPSGHFSLGRLFKKIWKAISKAWEAIKRYVITAVVAFVVGTILTGNPIGGLINAGFAVAQQFAQERGWTTVAFVLAVAGAYCGGAYQGGWRMGLQRAAGEVFAQTAGKKIQEKVGGVGGMILAGLARAGVEAGVGFAVNKLAPVATAEQTAKNSVKVEQYGREINGDNIVTSTQHELGWTHAGVKYTFPDGTVKYVETSGNLTGGLFGLPSSGVIDGAANAARTDIMPNQVLQTFWVSPDTAANMISKGTWGSGVYFLTGVCHDSTIRQLSAAGMNAMFKGGYFASGAWASA
ncbi:MAG: hypothetical protein HY906_03370, partial [Deltaproteobacteria bacterium]|nr:hypothetical protein [Deltaproteobacteria bacterium]